MRCSAQFMLTGDPIWKWLFVLLVSVHSNLRWRSLSVKFLVCWFEGTLMNASKGRGGERNTDKRFRFVRLQRLCSFYSLGCPFGYQKEGERVVQHPCRHCRIVTQTALKKPHGPPLRGREVRPTWLRRQRPFKYAATARYAGSEVGSLRLFEAWGVDAKRTRTMSASQST